MTSSTFGSTWHKKGATKLNLPKGKQKSQRPHFLEMYRQKLSVGSYIAFKGDEGNLEAGQTVRGLLLH